jgi:uncharacterized membrane protein
MSDEFQTKRAWEIYEYSDNLMAQRMNYGMVAQSMLLLSFVTLFVYQHQVQTYSFFLELIIGILGLLYSGFQYLRTKSLSERLAILRSQYLKDDSVFATYTGVRSMDRRIRQYTVPLVFCVGWIFLLVMAIVAFVRT